MIKILIVVGVVVVVMLWLGAGRVKTVQQRRSHAKLQAMVPCAHCGVHLPLAEAVADASGRYCNEAHRLAGPR